MHILMFEFLWSGGRTRALLCFIIPNSGLLHLPSPQGFYKALFHESMYWSLFAVVYCIYIFVRTISIRGYYERLWKNMVLFLLLVAVSEKLKTLTLKFRPCLALTARFDIFNSATRQLVVVNHVPMLSGDLQYLHCPLENMPLEEGAGRSH